MLLKCCTQYVSKFGKLNSGHRTGKDQFSFQSPKKAIPKNAQTTAQLHSSHTQRVKHSWATKHTACASNVTLDIHQARLQQDVNREFPDVQAGFRKGRGTRDQIANICWVIEKAREFQKKTSTSALLTMPKPLTVWITTNWNILQEMGIADHLTCLLRNLYAGQEAAVRTRHGTTDWFQIGEGIHQGCIVPCCLFNLYAEHITQNARLDE